MISIEERPLKFRHIGFNLVEKKGNKIFGLEIEELAMEKLAPLQNYIYEIHIPSAQEIVSFMDKQLN